MEQHEIRANLRVQIELEHPEPAYRNLRGIVIGNTEDLVVLMADFGEVIEIQQEDILSCTPTTLPKIVSDSLQELRNVHEEIYQLRQEMKEKNALVPHLYDALHDSHFLSKYNIRGAKNRIEHTLSADLLNFKSKDFDFEIQFASNKNNEIEMEVTVKYLVEYPQFDQDRDVDRLIRAHAPDAEEWLAKAFPLQRKLESVEKGVRHHMESKYYVKSVYKLSFGAERDDFLELRKSLVTGLEKLKR